MRDRRRSYQRPEYYWRKLLSDPAILLSVSELRASRTRRRAALHWRDGRVDEFGSSNSIKGADRFHVEGVLPASLLKLVADALQAARAK